MKPKLSQGHDNISTKIMKAGIIEVAKPLTYIFNLSLSSGIVPKQLKVATIEPIHKAGDRGLFNNYRPISILPAFSKLLEKVMATRLCKFLESHSLLYKHQYGFRKGHATIHPIIHFLNHIAQSNDKPNKELTIGLFLDLSKAFDTVSHDILLKKLNRYGIRGIANDWFRSYLSERVQYTSIGKHVSTRKLSTCGVPQGSILGPLLFLIYINDLHNATELNILTFADDTTAFMSHKCPNELVRKTNVELRKIYEWCCVNKLSLNTKKSFFSIYGPKQNITLNETITLKNNIIARVKNDHNSVAKFLGVYLDEHLTWKFHVNKIRSKISQAIYALNKVKNILPLSTMKTIYYSLVHSNLTYGILAWGNSASANSLFKLQKKAIRMLNNKKYNSHTEPLFKLNNILTLKDQYTFEVLTFMFDFINTKLPVSFNNLYSRLNREGIGTRQSLDILYPGRPRTKFSEYLPRHVFLKTWNNLEDQYKRIKNRQSFRRMIRDKFVSMYANSVQCDNVHCPDCN